MALGSGEGCATADEADDAIDGGGITAGEAMTDGADDDGAIEGKDDITDPGDTMA